MGATFCRLSTQRPVVGCPKRLPMAKMAFTTAAASCSSPFASTMPAKVGFVGVLKSNNRPPLLLKGHSSLRFQCGSFNGSATQTYDSVEPHIREDLKSILIEEKDIRTRVEQLGVELARDYAGKAPLVLGTLVGAFIFTADLVRSMKPSPPGMQLDFVRASSYGHRSISTGEVEVDHETKVPVQGRHVIVVEDIVDTGHTATALRRTLLDNGAASVVMVSLLSKPSRRQVEVPVEYVGFEVPNDIVVGYGLDYNEQFRYLPYIGALKEEVIKS